MQGWLESAEHCENLMDAKFGDVAVACVAQPGTQWGTYWTMVLARK
ncbi:CAP domain-containing protein [Ramlibacter montanisoli]